MIDPYHQRAGHPARSSLPPVLTPYSSIRFLLRAHSRCLHLPRQFPILHHSRTLQGFESFMEKLERISMASFYIKQPLFEACCGYLRLTSCLPLCGVEKGASLPFCGRHQRYHRDRGPLLLRGVRPGIVVVAVQHVGFRLRDSLASREEGNAMAIVIPF